MDRSVTEFPSRAPAPVRGQRVALVDLLDRLLAGGVVIAGDVTISIADVDLVRISLRALVASIRPEMSRLAEPMGDVDTGEAEPVRTIPGVVTREDTEP